jgi:hypothetical protein
VVFFILGNIFGYFFLGIKTIKNKTVKDPPLRILPPSFEGTLPPMGLGAGRAVSHSSVDTKGRLPMQLLVMGIGLFKS